MTKRTFCTKLCELLQQTDECRDLMQLEYHEDIHGEEWVTPIWKSENGGYFGKSISVTADSMTAIIKDVLRGIA